MTLYRSQPQRTSGERSDAARTGTLLAPCKGRHHETWSLCSRDRARGCACVRCGVCACRRLSGCGRFGPCQLGEFEAWVDQQTDTLKAEIAELQKELASSTDEDKDRIDEMLEQADAMTDDLRAQADQIGTATSDQWEEVKANVLGGWHRTQAAYYAALAELRDKD